MLSTGKDLRAERRAQLEQRKCYRHSIRECVICHQPVEWWISKKLKFFLLTTANLQLHSECCTGWFRNRPPGAPMPRLRRMRGVKQTTGGKQ